MTISTDVHQLFEVLSPHEGHGGATACPVGEGGICPGQVASSL